MLACVKERAGQILKDIQDADLFSTDVKLSDNEVLSCVVYTALLEITILNRPKDAHTVQGFHPSNLSLCELLKEAQIEIK